MTNGIHATSLAIVRSTHLARDAVLVSLFGFFVVFGTLETLSFVIWLIDLVGLIFLWIPRDTWQRVGCGWGVLLSVGLLFIVFQFSGIGSLLIGLMMILLLCIIEILAVLKIGYDILTSNVRSWTDDTKTPT